MQKEKPEGCREKKKKERREMEDKRIAWRNSLCSYSSSQLCLLSVVPGHWRRKENRQKGRNRRKKKKIKENRRNLEK